MLLFSLLGCFSAATTVSATEPAPDAVLLDTAAPPAPPGPSAPAPTPPEPLEPDPTHPTDPTM